jgi:dipeptide/tripeptide permease
MGLVSGWVTRVDRQGAVVLSAICVWGVAIALFGLSHSLALAVVFLALAGAGDLVSSVLRTSMLQTAAPDNMRGRMQGVFIVVVAGGPRLGDLRSGAMAAAVGVPATMVSGGIAILVGMGVVALVVPSFRRFRASQAHGGA